MIRRLPAAARWCALIAVVNAVVWSVVTPPFHVPDETVHVAYVQYLSQTGKAPNAIGKGVFADEEVGLLESLWFGSTVGRPFDRGPITSIEDGAVKAAGDADADRVGQGGTTNASSQPPLYYGLSALIDKASSPLELRDRLGLMRLLSALLAGITTLFAVMFLREVLPSEPWSWTVGGVAVAFQPMFGFIASGVNPDSLLFAASAALFYTLAVAFRRGLVPRTGLAIGAALAVGVLAKINFVALVPGAIVALALLVARTPGERRAAAARGAGLAFGVLGVVAIAYVALNVGAWDRSAWGGGVEAAAAAAGGQEGAAGGPITLTNQLSYTWQLYLPRLPFMNDQFAYFPPWQSWFKGTIGVFGWLDTPFPGWVYVLAAIVVVPLLILAILALARRRDALVRRWPELVAYGVIVAGLLGSIGFLGLRYRTDTGFAFEQARYLLPLLPLYAALVALAAIGAGRRFGRPVGAAIGVLAMAHGLFAQLLVISRFYG